MMAHTVEAGNAPSLDSLLGTLRDFVRHAVAAALPAHQVERQIFTHILALGREAFALFLRRHGPGDLGERLTVDGRDLHRLKSLHDRPYRSVFGDFTLARAVYGSREGQKIDFVPLDARLQLPESDYSYLLQEWDQTLGCEAAFGRVAATLQAILGVAQPVDSLERSNRQLAEAAAPFRPTRPQPAAAAEGDVFVLSDDAKGVVMRRDPDEKPAAFRKRGDKANKKRMAIVGTVYSVDRYVRTPDAVVAALFRDPRRPGVAPPPRPQPVGKHVWARLSQAADGTLAEPLAAVFSWQAQEWRRRDPERAKAAVCVMDGEPCLWDAKADHFGAAVVEILDLLHVTPKLWQAAHLFHPAGSAAAQTFVRQRVQRVLEGQVRGVLKGLRRMGTTHGLTGQKKNDLRKLCRYLSNNAARMRYDDYLREGYPIASGVIEGACRHYVKDRLERAGMRWTRAGAQAMLDVRSEYLNGDWAAFHAFRIERETRRLYPHRQLLETVEWPLAA